jgi:hypothetical protein
VVPVKIHRAGVPEYSFSQALPYKLGGDEIV